MRSKTGAIPHSLHGSATLRDNFYIPCNNGANRGQYLSVPSRARLLPGIKKSAERRESDQSAEFLLGQQLSPSQVQLKHYGNPQLCAKLGAAACSMDKLTEVTPSEPAPFLMDAPHQHALLFYPRKIWHCSMLRQPKSSSSPGALFIWCKFENPHCSVKWFQDGL
eukprot:1137235-Pelagomonas_calceolata.AAC.6